jgi:hypothetical protein
MSLRRRCTYRSMPVAAKVSKAEKVALKQAAVACKAEARGKRVGWLARRKFVKTWALSRSRERLPEADNLALRNRPPRGDLQTNPMHRRHYVPPACSQHELACREHKGGSQDEAQSKIRQARCGVATEYNSRQRSDQKRSQELPVNGAQKPVARSSQQRQRHGMCNIRAHDASDRHARV